MATAEKESFEEGNLPPTKIIPYPTAGYAWYVVGVLTLVYVFSFIDRMILNLLVAPIRRDLGISDTQMSLLLGFSFAVFYTFFGVILGRLADTRNRRTLIAVGFVFWSLMTTFCGLANSFLALLFFRFGVGIGEATLGPSAFSLLSDYFPPEKRATAMSVYSMGIYIGAGIASLLGGLVVTFSTQQNSLTLPLIGSLRSWQLIFIMVGLPGIFLSAIMFTVREPVRRGVKAINGGNNLWETFAYMKHNKTAILCHNFGIALLTICSYGAGAWTPTYFVRLHGWTAGEIGIAMGIISLVLSAGGVVLGGRIADVWAQRGTIDASLRVALYAVLLSLPFAAAFPLLGKSSVSLFFYSGLAFFSSVPIGVGGAALQQMIPNEMRGTATAFYFFIINLLGLGLGPTLVAVTTDYFFKNDNAVGYSLSIICSMSLIFSAVLLGSGLKYFRNCVEAVKNV